MVKSLGNLGKYADILVFLNNAVSRWPRLIKESHEVSYCLLDNGIVLHCSARLPFLDRVELNVSVLVVWLVRYIISLGVE